MPFVVIKVLSAEQSSCALCAVKKEDMAFGCLRKVMRLQNLCSSGEINLNKWENRDYVGMKMTHRRESCNAHFHLSLHSRVLISCQLKSKRGNSSTSDNEKKTSGFRLQF